MKQARPLATILFYFTRILALPYLATAVYSIITFAFNTSALHVTEDGNVKRFVIDYPFTNVRFLLGDEYSVFYITEMIAFIGLYGIFFWTLGNIFKTFRQEKIFTAEAVRRLKTFYLLNFLVPLFFLIVHVIIGYEVATVLTLSLLHATLGVFAYYMAVIFSQGLKLQDEQDLIF